MHQHTQLSPLAFSSFRCLPLPAFRGARSSPVSRRNPSHTWMGRRILARKDGWVCRPPRLKKKPGTRPGFLSFRGGGLVDRHPAQNEEVVRALSQVDVAFRRPDQGLHMERHIGHFVAHDGVNFVEHGLTLGIVEFDLNFWQ